MTEPSRIAVIMSTFAEQPEWLRASIESILMQTLRDLRFYIVLDNPDNHEVNAIVQAYADQDERIVVLANESNQGLTRSLNRAIETSEEPYIARMDADDIAQPNRLRKELHFLQDNQLDLVASGADVISDGGLVAGRKLPTMFTGALSEIEGFTNVMFHPTWLARREVYEVLGGYREISSCEDYDFILRAFQHGFKLGRMADMLLAYRFAENGISSSSWIIQEKNARFLKDCYRKGRNIGDIPVTEINDVSAGSSEEDSLGYSFAKRSYDGLFAAVGSRKIPTALVIFARGMLGSRVFRQKMADALRERVMIPKICKRYEGEALHE
ncbi:glycosyltransferase [Adlercreutzia murintestinalis]|uniref:glycosyltransferase n=1 Tax=Adlercreutzia murintestinalis TaxID=2941325 RepID=UPI00203B337C|nr:glycosyltransferase [Adlercreutzia murintestinalis]